MKGRETFYRRQTVPVTSCSEVKYVLKRVSVESKKCIKELKPEYAKLASFGHLGLISMSLQNLRMIIEISSQITIMHFYSSPESIEASKPEKRVHYVARAQEHVVY